MADLIERLNAALAGRYAIQRELGRGGMAAVFLAQDLRHRRAVAVKVLHPELGAAVDSERFLREIEIAAGLTHPHILPLHDSGSAGGLLFYVMPFVEGESLRARLDREPQLPLKDALRLAAQVASALDYAHRRGVVHRDIKPENILLADGQAMVADFGIARAVATAGERKLTQTGITLGTPQYMSPEQAAGSGVLDGRSDLYTLGCVLYEMLAGQPPFTGATAASVVHQHLNVPPRPAGLLRPTVPAEVERALETALAKTPADRFATAAEFAAAIATTGQTEARSPSDSTERRAPRTEPESKPVSTQAVTKVIARDHRRGLVAAIGAVALIGLGLIVWRFGPWHGDRTPAPGKRAWMLVAEFDGPAADSSTVAAARDLVMSGLEQSEIVAVVPSEQIRVALQMSGRPTSTRVDAELARELAYRSSVRTVLEGRIGRLGRGYSVVLRVVDVDSGRVVVSLSDAASDEQALIPTVSRVVRRLRADLGERRAAIQATREQFVQVTPSLEALKARLRALDLIKRNDQRGAIAMARSALAYDPEYPGPWATMGYAFSNLGEADSAAHAFQQALAHPKRLTQTSELFFRAALASVNGDNAGALTWLDRLVQVAPDNEMAHGNRGGTLSSDGRLNEALESYRTAEKVSPFGPSQQTLGNQLNVLLVLGRVDEARHVASRLTGSMGLRAPMYIAAAAGQWPAAESLASALRANPAAYEDHRLEARRIVAACQSARGRVEAADQTLRQVQSEAEIAGGTLVANQAKWTRLQLSLFSRGVSAAPSDPGRWDGTTMGLVTRAAWSAAAGDTTGARRQLAMLRTRSAADIARQGFSPAMARGWIAARAGRWRDVVQELGPAALQGEPRGYILFNSAPLTRWLVAEAYERLGQPDSAAAYFERAIAPPPAGGYDFADIRMASSFGHRRLVLLNARMGRLEDARRHWEIFASALRNPDPAMAPLIEEARAALAGAEGMARSARR